MKRFELALVIGMIAAVGLSSVGAFGAQCEEVRAGVLRLHILANSDEKEDQALKLKVRDAVLNETIEMFSDSDEKAEIEAVTRERLEVFEEAAKAVVKAEGYDYEVSARIVNMYFETREYEGIKMPAGRYDAVRMTIGEGEGANWWCVMFPPMCVPAATGKQSLAVEGQIARLNETPRYIPKFAVVEFIERLRERV
ncbi:MAG: stage II sporulation protein R [Oscillospiraceae bacterium]|jgi:stage II sporulation protein R|nr:stage II sporulation protein R [Oscillospiraceae bacterium]